MLNAEQIGGLVRAVLPPMVAWLTLHGVNIPNANDFTSAAVVVVTTAIVAGWSYFTNKSGTVIK